MTGPWDGLLHPPRRRPMDGIDRDYKPVGRVHLIEDDAPAPLTGAAAGGATLRRKALGVAPPAPGITKQMAKADRKAAARGERFLPLMPGQKRRTRVDAAGNPIKRGASGGYERTAPTPAPAAAQPPPPPVPAPTPASAPAITYQQAVAVRLRALVKGQPVPAAELAEANRIVEQRRAEVRAALKEGYEP